MDPNKRKPLQKTPKLEKFVRFSDRPLCDNTRLFYCDYNKTIFLVIQIEYNFILCSLEKAELTAEHEKLTQNCSRLSRV